MRGNAEKIQKDTEIIMVKNDLRKDIKELLIIKGKRQSEIAERMGWQRQNLNKLTQMDPLNRNWTKMIEEIGYDVEIMYVER